MTLRKARLSLSLLAIVGALAPMLYWRAYNASLIQGVWVDIPSTDFVDGRVLTYDTGAGGRFKLEAGGSASSVTLNGDVTGPSGSNVVSDVSIITSEGDVLVGNSSGNAVRLPIGANGKVLKVNTGVAGKLEWATDSTGTGTNLVSKGQVQGYDGAANQPVGPGTDGQILTANSGSSNGAEFLSLNGDVTGPVTNTTVTDLTIASEARGDLLARSATNWARLAIGTSGKVLSSDGTDPGWTAFGGDVSGAPGSLAVNDISVVTTRGDLLAGNASGNAARLAIGASGRVLSSDGTDPSWVAYAGDVTGSPGASTVVDLSLASEARGDLAARGATNWARLPIGASGRVLSSDGTDPGWTEYAGDVTGTPGASTVVDLSLASEARGDLAYRGATNWLRRAVGTTNQVLRSDGTDPVWTTLTGGDVGGTPGALTVTDLSLTSEAHGDITYRGSSNWLRLAPGTSGQVLSTNGAGAAPSWITAGGHPDVQTFDAAGTYTWNAPSGATWVMGYLKGGGGGGGSGRKGAAGSARFGGGGGAGGGAAVFFCPASSLGSSQSVVIGGGGAGGAAQATNSTDGNNGGAGVDTTFAIYVGVGGQAGSGGTAAAGAAGSGRGAPTSIMNSSSGTAGPGGAGQSGTGSTASSHAFIAAGTGGGGGGGISSGNARSDGGSGGGLSIAGSGTSVLFAAYAGGAAGTGDAGAGATGQAPQYVVNGGTGGGGGAASLLTNGGAGGAGGIGAGGGGGGASVDAVGSSGAGGAGGAGRVVIIAW